MAETLRYSKSVRSSSVKIGCTNKHVLPLIIRTFLVMNKNDRYFVLFTRFFLLERRHHICYCESKRVHRKHEDLSLCVYQEVFITHGEKKYANGLVIYCRNVHGKDD